MPELRRYSRFKKYMNLVVVAICIFLFCCIVLPRLAAVSYIEVVRNNLKKDIDATAYFYTELERYSEYEKAVEQENSSRH